jgi:TRAP-type uncharacterized transport system fused permease subunit
VKLGIAAFLIPFAFVYNPGLMMVGSIPAIVQATVTALIGACLVAAAMRGFLLSHMNIVQRIIIFAAGLMFIAPGLKFAGIGLLLTLVAIVPDILRMMREREARAGKPATE